MPSTEITPDLVIKTASAYGLSLGQDVADQLVMFIQQLCLWGKKINLTGRPDPLVLLERHLPDSFALASTLMSPSLPPRLHESSAPGIHDPSDRPGLEKPACPSQAAIDFGAGAGLPAIPLAMCLPGLQLTLVEPNQKKCSFLRTVRQSMLPDLEIVPRRMEQAPRGIYDLVSSRATWAPGEWLERAAPWLGPDGRAVLYTAREDEVPRAPKGLSNIHQVKYQLVDGSPRTISFFAK